MTLPENTILENRYRIDRLLARGGMGAIYRGFDTNLNISVAIKENFFQTPHSIQQFQQEALILARLRHPGLPRVIHHFSFEGRQYLVMDFIEGQDLWEIVKKQGLPLKEAYGLDYIIQVCDAVSYLHRQKPSIIHRDIKPQNIKITPDNRAVLVDFGIAKVGGDDSQTRTGARGVTPGFSPPEQYSGVGTTTVSDVYALGATLYAVLTGKKPPDSVSLMVGGVKFQPPDAINPTLSHQVSQAIVHAMEVQQADRPQSVAIWQKELKAIFESTTTTGADHEDTLAPGKTRAPDVEQTMAGPMARVETTVYWLVDSSGLGYPIGSEPLVIGRHSEADVVIKVLSASRHHAFIRAEGQRCLVKDNDSANGTFINNERLGLEWYPINPGDTFTVGTARFNITTTRPLKVASVTPKPRPAVDDQAGTVLDPSMRPAPPPTADLPVMPRPVPAPSPPSPPPISAPPVTPRPARSKKVGISILPIIIAVVIVLGAVGVAAYFLYSSGAFLSPTPTAVALEETISTQTPTIEVLKTEAEKTKTAQAEAEEDEQEAVAASETMAAKTVAAKITPTATATKLLPTATSTKPLPTATSTKPLPTATSTKPLPTATSTRAASPTRARPTATPIQTPTATPRPAPIGGPTVIPLESEVSIPQIGIREVTDVDINLKNPKEVYALVKGDGIYKSSNGGDGPWAKMKLDGSAITTFVIDPTNPARFFAPTWNAVVRSDDGGNTWKAFGNGLSTANRVVDVVIVDVESPNVVYAGIGSTLVVSTDGGENWASDEYGHGLGGGRITSIVVDPFNHDIIYVGGEFGSIYKSVDSGRNFLQLAFGTGRGTFGLVAHPTQKGVYLAGINSYDAGIIKTENGADFQSASNGLVYGGADSAYSGLIYAPSNSNIVYTGSGYEDDRFAKGIFKSTNGGQDWTKISNGLSINPATGQPHYVKSIAVHPTDPDIVFAATGGGLYKSIDGGQNWGLQ